MALPLIDLAAEDAAALARRIDAALCEHGFFAVTGHGVPGAMVAAAFDAGHRLFALPEADKRRWHIDGWAEQAPWPSPATAASRGAAQVLGRPGDLLKRGFDPIGWQALDPASPPDLKESFYLGV
jgi:isopenicillin N synthase-like dioxygenase